LGDERDVTRKIVLGTRGLEKSAPRSLLTRAAMFAAVCRSRDERVEQDVAGYDSSRRDDGGNDPRVHYRPLARPRSSFVNTR
jgi:hypothetical protein